METTEFVGLTLPEQIFLVGGMKTMFSLKSNN